MKETDSQKITRNLLEITSKPENFLQKQQVLYANHPTVGTSEVNDLGLPVETTE